MQHCGRDLRLAACRVAGGWRVSAGGGVGSVGVADGRVRASRESRPRRVSRRSEPERELV